MGIVHLSDGGFEQEVLRSAKPVLVDLWAPWCASCVALTAILEQLSKEYKDKLKICKINIDEHKSVATKYQVLSIPTLLFFKDGKIVTQIVGDRSASDIKNTVDSLI